MMAGYDDGIGAANAQQRSASNPGGASMFGTAMLQLLVILSKKPEESVVATEEYVTFRA